MSIQKLGAILIASLLIQACGDDRDFVPTQSQLAKGKQLYQGQCQNCHGEVGEGVGSYPALIHGKCDACDNQEALSNLIEETMPLGGEVCDDDCATNIAAHIIQNFDLEERHIASCEAQSAPIRRLNRFEYSNTLEDLLGDKSRPGNLLPSEEIGNGFGNDARSMSTSNLLAEQYLKVSDQVADATVNDEARWNSLHDCIKSLSSSNEDSCAESLIDKLLYRAFRRPVPSEELRSFITFYEDLRRENDFKSTISGVISAILQSPEFLYRAEFGAKDSRNRLATTAYERASRLSYFLWGSMPDEALFEAARTGELGTARGIKKQAERMLSEPKSRRMMEYFFDSLLPISSLKDLERSADDFPKFSAEIGALMREEVHTLIQHMVYEKDSDWKAILTTPYTFMNEKLAEFYGVSGIQGSAFQKTDLVGVERLGILTSAGVMAGTIHSGTTNPVTRGAYIMKHMLCVDIPLPTGEVADLVFPPKPDGATTARERFSQHSTDQVCRNCHNLMDPVGFVFEQFDPIGLFRTHENGKRINTTGELPGSGIFVTNAVEMARAIASDERTHQCFAYNWTNFAYGKTVGSDEACVKEEIQEKFKEANYNVKSLLIGLTQTDAFMYLPEDHLR